MDMVKDQLISNEWVALEPVNYPAMGLVEYDYELILGSTKRVIRIIEYVKPNWKPEAIEGTYGVSSWITLNYHPVTNNTRTRMVIIKESFCSMEEALQFVEKAKKRMEQEQYE